MHSNVDLATSDLLQEQPIGSSFLVTKVPHSVRKEAKQDDLSSSISSCSTIISSRSRVQFKDVEIREYNLTIGDNPACSSGCPVRYDIISFSLDCLDGFPPLSPLTNLSLLL